uniref:Uncharacterized protein n=1 Tax=Anopheles atroparvus TaxID=41427 RepID=A0AAG5D8V3_ANOAO
MLCEQNRRMLSMVDGERKMHHFLCAHGLAVCLMYTARLTSDFFISFFCMSFLFYPNYFTSSSFSLHSKTKSMPMIGIIWNVLGRGWAIAVGPTAVWSFGLAKLFDAPWFFPFNQAFSCDFCHTDNEIL